MPLLSSASLPPSLHGLGLNRSSTSSRSGTPSQNFWDIPGEEACSQMTSRFEERTSFLTQSPWFGEDPLTTKRSPQPKQTWALLLALGCKRNDEQKTPEYFSDAPRGKFVLGMNPTHSRTKEQIGELSMQCSSKRPVCRRGDRNLFRGGLPIVPRSRSGPSHTPTIL